MSFKDKQCVQMTLEEIDEVKDQLKQEKKFKKLQIVNWEIQPSFPPNDIVWSNLHRIEQGQQYLKDIGLAFLNLVQCFAVSCIF